mgnify:FL=1
MIKATLHSLKGFFNSVNIGLGVIGTKISDCMLPALFNQFIISVKDTALLSAIAVNEITHQAQAYAALSFKAIPTYTALAVFYLIILSILIIVQKQIERKMR